VKLLAPLLVALPLLAGCGMQGEPPVGSGSGSGPSGTIVSESPEPSPKPPVILFVSPAGKQSAVPGTYCMNAPGSGVCADSAPVHPEQVSVVPAAEHLTLLLVDAALDGKATVTVRPLGCERKEIATVDASDREAFGLDLGPGDYQLDVFAPFVDGPQGSNGDVSGSVGLVIDPQARPKVEPASPGRSGC
jgi:hypothetical protein